MKNYCVTFNTKLENIDSVVNAYNVRHCKFLIERILNENPEIIHVELFSKYGVYSRSKNYSWVFQNYERR